MSLVQVIDHAAMLPAYVAVGTAVAVLLADLLVARWGATVATAAVGALATAGTAIWVGRGGDRATFCVETGCSYVFGDRAALVARPLRPAHLRGAGAVGAVAAGRGRAGGGVLLPARLLDDRRGAPRRGR